MENYDNGIEFKVLEREMDCGVNIKVIGVGGAGGNMINYMIENCNFASAIDLMIANTDIQDINKSKANKKIQLGPKKTEGRGAGAIPEVGRISAEEVEDEIKELLGNNTDLLFIAAGLGGGTGTGAAPVIAKIAKSLGILVVSVVTTPFSFERGRGKVALEGLAELKKESDSVIHIQNDKLITFAPKNLNPKKVFEFVDEILAKAVSGIINVLLEEGDINIDFADFRTVMSHRGIALMGKGEAKGENALYAAYQNAIDAPLLDCASSDLNDAKGVIVFFKYGEKTTFLELTQAMDEIGKSDDDNKRIFLGCKLSSELEPDVVEVTIIATGFDETMEEKAQIQAEEKRKEEEKNHKIAQAEIKKVSGGTNKIDYKNRNFDEPAYVRLSQD